MRNTRKGFTLVELLIVVAILGTLSASMMISFGNSAAKAKAATIAANIDACITAAKLYLADNINDIDSTKTSGEFLKANSDYIPNWDKFGSGTVKYEAGSGTYADGWNMTVTITAADMPEIVTALKTIKGYESATDFPAPAAANTTYIITVLLLKGTATGAAS